MSGPDLLAHRADGAGEELLLLNGGMMTMAAWEPVARGLGEGWRLLQCDLRGQLLSPGPGHRALEGHVGDVVALLDALEVERAHLLGVSFGAEVALLAAALHPKRVRSLVAVTATDFADGAMRRGVEEMAAAVAEILAGGGRDRFFDLLVEGVYTRTYVDDNRDAFAARRAQTAALPQSWFEGLADILATTATIDLRSHLGRIRCPTLVVVAGGDRVIPPARSRALARAIPGAEVAELAASGHALVVEHPEWLAATCLAFLARVRRRHAG